MKMDRQQTYVRFERIEQRLFTGATAVGVLHAVDDALLNRQPGVPLAQHLPALVITLLVAAAGVLSFGRARPGLRAALALSFGVLTTVNGAQHVIHVHLDSVSGSDITGLAAATAGVVLVVLAAAVPFLHRGEKTDRRWQRRWARRAVAALSTAVLAIGVLMPLSVAIVQTHKFREPIGAPPSTAYRDVTFESTDGLQLSGWYRPSTNGAAVILVSTAGGDRVRTVSHAELLAAHGYGVLLYDARGTGESEGTPNGYGWGWAHDVEGAIAFLGEQPDVDADRIGALGLSTGADVLIEVAAHNHDLRAVVGDGATGSSMADMPPGDVLNRVMLWPMFAGVQVFSGTKPGPALEELVAEVAPTPLLLIAAGSLPLELQANARYAAAAAEPVELWSLPDVRHTAAITQRAEEYERRVVGHFDAALLAVGGAG